MDDFLDRLVASVTSARTLEELTRPLLEMLQTISGLDSAYLTVIDLDRDEQRILFSHNTHTMNIPEGLAVSWGDTLCKRALDEGQPFTSNVSKCWGDSEAAKALGIETYVSTPVRLGDESLFGTLCAASTQSRLPSAEVERVLVLFSTLIGQHIEREQLLRQLVLATEQLAQQARTDSLTGLPNRRALLSELTRMLAHCKRAGSHLLVAYIDLDGFKAINDTYGHELGDTFLIEIAARLKAGLRGEDLAARIGGDEFVVVGLGPSEAAEAERAGEQFAVRISDATKGHFALGSDTLDYLGASVGLAVVASSAVYAEKALSLADTAMYERKRLRRMLVAEQG
ncbi:sensor domain-containing diguanylate cyclase [Curvibacter lanceolatus]|uniref:sensor domain-containing diguanylate cyclase n=1 Tax=Curvibacter lanceolatus TaxID=86182 RepID=UPI000369FAF0|nr:sensor domain-containing diguanylate cyclase [Curvibacter lanceolatus]